MTGDGAFEYVEFEEQLLRRAGDLLPRRAERGPGPHRAPLRTGPPRSRASCAGCGRRRRRARPAIWRLVPSAVCSCAGRQPRGGGAEATCPRDGAVPRQRSGRARRRLRRQGRDRGRRQQRPRGPGRVGRCDRQTRCGRARRRCRPGRRSRGRRRKERGGDRSGAHRRAGAGGPVGVVIDTSTRRAGRRPGVGPHRPRRLGPDPHGGDAVRGASPQRRCHRRSARDRRRHAGGGCERDRRRPAAVAVGEGRPRGARRARRGRGVAGRRGRHRARRARRTVDHDHRRAHAERGTASGATSVDVSSTRSRRPSCSNRGWSARAHEPQASYVAGADRPGRRPVGDPRARSRLVLVAARPSGRGRRTGAGADRPWVRGAVHRQRAVAPWGHRSVVGVQRVPRASTAIRTSRPAPTNCARTWVWAPRSTRSRPARTSRT